MSPAQNPDWERLLARAQRSLERTGGSLEAAISLTEPTEAERRIVIGITGVYRSMSAGRVAVRLADIDRHLISAHGTRLSEVVEQFAGGPIRNRPAQRELETAARDAVMALAMRSRYADQDWFALWLDGLRRDGLLTRLIRTHTDFGAIVRVLDALPAQDEPMPAFAERLLADTKALADTSTRHVLLRAIAVWQNAEPPSNAEQERELWESVGVIPDDLASQVLVLNLRATGGLVGSWLAEAAEAGVPLRLTLHQLRLAPLVLLPNSIYVTENPAVLRAACVMGASAPALICTEGVPSAATHRLLSYADQATLWWRNDFDWSGVRVTAAALKRYSNARPWRMSAADYRSHADTGLPLVGAQAGTPWDPALGEEMLRYRRAVMEERLLPCLLDDLGLST